jgi:hypothetical protein
MTESQEQTAFVEWFRLQYPKEIVFAIPNGANKSIATAMKFKREGLRPGVPDLFIATQPGIFIEMKAKTGRVSKKQKEMIAALRGKGYIAEVCFGFEEAKALANKYLNPLDKRNERE